MISKIEQALIWMLQEISKGREYPDAHTSAAIKFGVDADELRDAYDAF
jgi:hypothetical protein